ncbi:MAG: nicotinate (nicotinamide) nucleotide adenylyltransferase [Clostridia bacterium]|nr:nicotinate (nicotinamide) nucleotide adenylyltransferase [Clostridia bacterium]
MKIGIFGGSFDPIHLGHIMTARFVIEELGLDKLYMVVAADAPHKNGSYLPANIRLRMAESAVRGEDRIFVSDAEIKRGGKSYTVDTLNSFRKQYRGAELFFIVGGDMLENFPCWRDPAGILRAASLVAVSRPDAVRDLESIAKNIEETFGGRVILSAFEGPPISSTLIRRNMFSAQPVYGLVPLCTELTMYENAYYMPEIIQSIRSILKERLKRKRLAHTMLTVREAVRLAAHYGVDTEKARLAALLHDCIKLPNRELVAFCDNEGIAITDEERQNPYLIHSRVGALLAETEFGVEDEEVLSAIRSHTLGRIGMSLLDKIVYVADKIEPSREYEGLDTIRATAYEDINHAMLLVMQHSADYTLKSGRNVNPSTCEVMQWLESERELNQ